MGKAIKIAYTEEDVNKMKKQKNHYLNLSRFK